MNGYTLLNLAREMARVAHHGQFRKGSGEDYFNHVNRVADNVHGWKAKVVAYLHDLVEDTPITLEMLSFLFPPDIVNAVDILSRRKDETYREFIERCIDSENRIAWEVKLADLGDNMRDIHLVPGGESMKQKRYAEPYARFFRLVYGS
jgi:(p)ppGpp synthase/HD superfamily hydrolase